MRVTLLGTGDSTGTPTVGCDCETCRAARDRDVERTRFSVHVQNGDASLLVDVSPDFRQQFLRDGVPLPDAAVLTHIHFDHLDGLGNAYRLFDDLAVYASGATDPATGESVADTIRSKYDYLDRITVHDVEPFARRRIAGLDVTLVPVDHPPLSCYGLSIEDPETGRKLSITGDTTYAIPEESLAVLDDPDLLLVDAFVPASFCENHSAGGAHPNADGVLRTFGTKHLTKEGALDVAAGLSATETRLVHASHFYAPDEAFEEPLAVDGERFEL